LIELGVANGRTESQFPLVPKAVLVCSYDVIGTIAIAASLLRIRRAAFCERESRTINENAPCSGLCDPDEMIPRLIVAYYLGCALFKQLN
jgi:hypothetical protein